MPAATLEGHTLGKYRVLEPLGRGGMAQVYRAYHSQLDRYVAIKVLRPDLIEEEEFLARFQREARAVAALRHPHIVQVFDFDVQDGLYFMVMELLEGDTLKARLNNYRIQGLHMPYAEIARILGEVLEGLGYAHQAGIVHRDIKPANILLTRQGQAVITDFGVAQIVGGTHYTISGALMGTLHYMAPEQGMTGHADQRSDLYSVGIMLYEMLTGRPPFDADTPLAILMKHVHDPLPLPRQLDPQIPEAFERVALKALTKAPEDRYADAHEMAQAILLATQSVGEAGQAPRPIAGTRQGEEAVAIYSGNARQGIEDAGFAKDDTDAYLSQKVAAAQEESEMPVEKLGVAFVQAPLAGSPRLNIGVEAGAPLTWQGISQAFWQVVDRLENRFGFAQGEDETPQVSPEQVREAGLALAGLIVIPNLLAVMMGTTSGWWGMFAFGWPIELLLVGTGLALLGAALARVWLLLPVGIILGNGILLSYFALTNRWGHWVFLWPLEVLLVGGSVWGVIQLARRPDGAARLSRRLALAAAVVGAAVIPFVVAGTLFIGLLQKILGIF